MGISSVASESLLQCLTRFGFRKVARGVRYVLFPYDTGIDSRLVSARAYQSLGDRDYL